MRRLDEDFNLVDLKAFDVLPNGATVIAAAFLSPTVAIVLAYFNQGWVTWRVNQNGTAYYGYYRRGNSKGFLEAVADFVERTQMGNLTDREIQQLIKHFSGEVDDSRSYCQRLH